MTSGKPSLFLIDLTTPNACTFPSESDASHSECHQQSFIRSKDKLLKEGKIAEDNDYFWEIN